MKVIPESLIHLLKDETKAYAFLGTTMPDGSPQVTPVWFNVEGEHIMINSDKGRVKDRNMRARPKVSVLIMAFNDSYNYLQIRGRVVEIIEEGGIDHINALGQKYTGSDFDPPKEHRRVIYKIKPENYYLP